MDLEFPPTPLYILFGVTVTMLAITVSVATHSENKPWRRNGHRILNIAYVASALAFFHVAVELYSQINLGRPGWLGLTGHLATLSAIEAFAIVILQTATHELTANPTDTNNNALG